jgi:5-formyltetrahydrofolate cyclo-ligase
LADGKVIALPCFDSGGQFYTPRRINNLRFEIVSGRFGIREPAAACAEIPPANLDLLLVPGIAFDWRGNRLGRGKGFYDRLLSKTRGVKCGIAFEEQLVEKVPTGSRDARVDFVLTPERCVKTAC